MLIRTDDGTTLVNLSNVNAIGIGSDAAGRHALVAYCSGSTTLLAVGDMERCERALDAITRKLDRKLLDLRDEVGQREPLQSQQAGGLVVPSGIPPEAIEAAQRIIGNGK